MAEPRYTASGYSSSGNGREDLASLHFSDNLGQKMVGTDSVNKITRYPWPVGGATEDKHPHEDDLSTRFIQKWITGLLENRLMKLYAKARQRPGGSMTTGTAAGPRKPSQIANRRHEAPNVPSREDDDYGTKYLSLPTAARYSRSDIIKRGKELNLSNEQMLQPADDMRKARADGTRSGNALFRSGHDPTRLGHYISRSGYDLAGSNYDLPISSRNLPRSSYDINISRPDVLNPLRNFSKTRRDPRRRSQPTHQRVVNPRPRGAYSRSWAAKSQYQPQTDPERSQKKRQQVICHVSYLPQQGKRLNHLGNGNNEQSRKITLFKRFLCNKEEPYEEPLEPELIDIIELNRKLTNQEADSDNLDYVEPLELPVGVEQDVNNDYDLGDNEEFRSTEAERLRGTAAANPYRVTRRQRFHTGYSIMNDPAKAVASTSTHKQRRTYSRLDHAMDVNAINKTTRRKRNQFGDIMDDYSRWNPPVYYGQGSRDVYKMQNGDSLSSGSYLQNQYQNSLGGTKSIQSQLLDRLIRSLSSGDLALTASPSGGSRSSERQRKSPFGLFGNVVNKANGGQMSRRSGVNSWFVPGAQSYVAYPEASRLSIVNNQQQNGVLPSAVVPSQQPSKYQTRLSLGNSVLIPSDLGMPYGIAPTTRNQLQQAATVRAVYPSSNSATTSLNRPQHYVVGFVPSAQQLNHDTTMFSGDSRLMLRAVNSPTYLRQEVITPEKPQNRASFQQLYADSLPQSFSKSRVFGGYTRQGEAEQVYNDMSYQLRGVNSPQLYSQPRTARGSYDTVKTENPAPTVSNLRPYSYGGNGWYLEGNPVTVTSTGNDPQSGASREYRAEGGSGRYQLKNNNGGLTAMYYNGFG